MRRIVKLPERFEEKSSLAEYLEDVDNGWFNTKCYEVILDYYQENHYAFSEEQSQRLGLTLFNRVYQCAVRNINGRIEPEWGMTINKEGTDTGAYIMPDGEDIAKHNHLPQVVMPVLYHLLQDYADKDGIGQILTKIYDNFRDDGKVLGHLSAVLYRASFYDIITYPDKEKLVSRIKYLIRGKGGADIGRVLRRCIDLGYIMAPPTQPQFDSLFTHKGSWQSVHNYIKGPKADNDDKGSSIIIFENEENVETHKIRSSIKQFR